MSHPPVVLGIDFGGTKIATAVCDLAGNRLAASVVDTGGDRGARAAFDHGIQTARDLLAACSAEASLAAVGVATFGIPFEDRVELAPSVDGWSSLPLGRELRAAFPGVGIRMATDAKAAAQAEARWGSLAGFEPAVYLNLGTGLAAAVVIGGTVLTGRHGAAGEIGYNLRSRGDVGLPPGQRIPLEDLVSGLALRRRASALGRELTAAEVFSGGQQDPALDELITDFVDELAFHVVNLAILVNPARIAVGGGMTRSWDRIRPALAEALSRGVPFPPELVLADFPHEAALLGAVALAIDAVPRARADDAGADADVTAGAGAFPTDPTAGAAGTGTKSTHPASSNGHYSTNRTNNASSRPQGSLPAGAPQATSISGARFGNTANPAGPCGQNSASKG